MRNLLLIACILISFQASAEYIYVTKSGVNLRKGPENTKKILRTVKKNEPVNIIDSSNEWWYEVEYEGTTGYIAKELIVISYPLTITDFSKKNPVAVIAIILLMFGIFYGLIGKSENKLNKKKVKPKRTNKKK